jgi:hypothetical protein
MWTVYAAGDREIASPVFQVETQARAVELAEKLRQDARFSRVSIVQIDDPCTRGLMRALTPV